MEAVIVLILVILIVCWACYKRRIIKAVYGIAALEIILQLFNLIANNIGENAVSKFMLSFPESLMAVAYEHTNTIIYKGLVWLFVGLMLIFLFETIKTLHKK